MRFIASLLVLAACSADPAQGPGVTPQDSGAPLPDAGQADTSQDPDATPDETITQSETWMDGKKLTSSVLIPEGVTVTIAAGAKVTCSAGVSITVLGTLTASSATPTHAQLTGASWAGIVDSGKGQVLLDGVDLVGAATGIDDRSSAPAKYDDGTIRYIEAHHHFERKPKY